MVLGFKGEKCESLTISGEIIGRMLSLTTRPSVIKWWMFNEIINLVSDN